MFLVTLFLDFWRVVQFFLPALHVRMVHLFTIVLREKKQQQNGTCRVAMSQPKEWRKRKYAVPDVFFLFYFLEALQLLHVDRFVVVVVFFFRDIYEHVQEHALLRRLPKTFVPYLRTFL